MSKKLMCSIFNCDRRKGNICCFGCGYKRSCKNSCLNNPTKCNCVKEDDK